MSNEYIRKQDAVDKIWIKADGFEQNYDILYAQGARAMAMVVEQISPADVAPVRHGKWTRKPDVYGVVYCSECDYELHANSTSFCPNCGAKMDGDE